VGEVEDFVGAVAVVGEVVVVVVLILWHTRSAFDLKAQMQHDAVLNQWHSCFQYQNAIAQMA
jgi:hypothetical protein